MATYELTKIEEKIFKKEFLRLRSDVKREEKTVGKKGEILLKKSQSNHKNCRLLNTKSLKNNYDGAHS